MAMRDRAAHYIELVIGVVILVVVVVALLPTLITNLTNLSGTMAAQGLPFSSLVSPTGIIGLLFAVGIFYTLYRLFWQDSGVGKGGRKF